MSVVIHNRHRAMTAHLEGKGIVVHYDISSCRFAELDPLTKTDS
jgi:hypothetical protein